MSAAEEPSGRRSVIPIVDLRRTTLPVAPIGGATPSPGSVLVDTLGRPLHDLRISVTDRCNFRCTYCMPKDVFDRDHRYLPQADLLTFEEIARIARASVALGVRKIRLTGGEPLLRKGLERLVAMLAAIRLRDHPSQSVDLTLTTNGALLRNKARSLADAGLRRVTISLDALDDARFRAMNDVDYPIAQVLDGIDAAVDAGLGPVKVNMVVQKGVNDDQIVPMAGHFRATGHVLRFIEFMDVGSTNGWNMAQVVPSRDVLARVHAAFPIEPLAAHYLGEVAERWRYRDGKGEIGAISSVTQSFCKDCTRARLSPDGSLYTCLFGSRGHDLRTVIRSTDGEALLTRAIASVWNGRDDRYSDLRGRPGTPAQARVEMSFIGG